MMNICRGSQHELKGCINDAHCMKYLLTSRLGFKDSDIVMLTDDQNNPQAWPTRGNMVGLKLPEILISAASSASSMGLDSLMLMFGNHKTPGLAHTRKDDAPKASHPCMLPMCISSSKFLRFRSSLTWNVCASCAAVPDADADTRVPAWRLPDLPLLWCAACCMPDSSQHVFTVAIALRPDRYQALVQVFTSFAICWSRHAACHDLKRAHPCRSWIAGG